MPSSAFFPYVPKVLCKIDQYSNFDHIVQNIEDPTLKDIVKYKTHLSILTIQARYEGHNKFSVTEVTTRSIKYSLTPLNDTTPLNKKGRKDKKQNYRSVSILPTLSKTHERNIFIQMSSFFEGIFSKHQCGFRKGFNKQQCLLTLMEKLKNAVDKNKMLGTLLADKYLDKCHLLVSSCENIKIEIGDFEIESSTYEKLLRAHFDNKLTFDYHMSGLCKKSGKKLMH